MLYIYVRWTFTYYLNATFCLAIPEIQKKQKNQKIKNKTGCFSFNFFLNFAKENWWEESFFFFFNFLNFGNPQRENWWEESFFFEFFEFPGRSKFKKFKKFKKKMARFFF